MSFGLGHPHEEPATITPTDGRGELPGDVTCKYCGGRSPGCTRACAGGLPMSAIAFTCAPVSRDGGRLRVIYRREGAQYVCEAKPGDTVHACACRNHVFTLPTLRFIRQARDGKSYVITPTLPSPR
jgi:hypothetical protein